MNALSATLALVLFLSFGASLPACADALRIHAELPAAKPEEVGMSSSKLAQVDAKVSELLGKKRLAGAAVTITRKGKMVYNKTFGLRDIAGEKKMEADTIFRIYSMTKSITSAAAMMLVEEGKLGLDDPLANHFPAFKNVKVWKEGKATEPAKAPTVRDLLRHTTGYSYGGTAVPEVTKAHLAANPLSHHNTLTQMAERMATVPLAFEPGSDWMYGVSTDLLGAVVEAASKTPFDQFLQKRIFTPLAMRDTSFTLDPAKKNRLAVIYQSNKRGSLADRGHDDSPYNGDAKMRSGGGGLLSTIRDYTRFLQMIANGGELQGVRLLKKQTVASMTRNQLPKEIMPVTFGPKKREGTGFGLGFSVKIAHADWNRHGRLGEYGWGGMASTHYWVSPRDHLVVVTMEQTLPFDFLLEDQLKPLIYAAIVE